MPSPNFLYKCLHFLLSTLFPTILCLKALTWMNLHSIDPDSEYKALSPLRLTACVVVFQPFFYLYVWLGVPLVKSRKYTEDKEKFWKGWKLGFFEKLMKNIQIVSDISFSLKISIKELSIPKDLEKRKERISRYKLFVNRLIDHFSG